MKTTCFICICFFISIACSCQEVVVINIYPKTTLNDVSNKPIGINLNYLMDDDKFLKPTISLVNSLKKMGVKYLRYPGGNKSDFYFFSKPPYSKSEPTLARTGRKAVGGRFTTLNEACTDFKEDPLDFDEFMLICKLVKAEPVIVVAADEYLVNYPKGSTWSTKEQLVAHAKEWVNYANIKKKYGIKYWMIGNESWHETNRNSNAKIYALDLVDFSKAMKAVDSSIYIIPNGNSKLWWDTVFTYASNYFDAISISNYPIYNYSRGFTTYADTLQSFTTTIDIAKAAISSYIPVSKQDKFKVIVAEYGPFDWANKWPHINNMGLCMANFEIIGQQLLDPKVDFSCFWNTRWINNKENKNDAFDAIDCNGNINAIGKSLMIWGNFLGDKMIKTTSQNYIKTFASIDSKKQQLFLYIVNKSSNPIKVMPSFNNIKTPKIIQNFSLTANNAEDIKPMWGKKNYWKNKDTYIELLPVSISVIVYNLKK